MTLAQTLIDAFRRDAEKTRKLLAVVPGDRLDYKPHEKSMSLAQLAGHLAETPAWLHAIVEGDSMDFADMDDYTPFLPGSTAELMEVFERNLAAIEALAGKDDTFVQAEWTMRMGDQVIMQEPRHDVIRDILIHHQAHHRGQLTVYLRLLDVPVPSTFGDSADEPMFQTA